MSQSMVYTPINFFPLPQESRHIIQNIDTLFKDFGTLHFLDILISHPICTPLSLKDEKVRLLVVNVESSLPRLHKSCRRNGLYSPSRDTPL